MKGINGNAYISADDFLDLSYLKNIELEICIGLALSEQKAGIYGPGIVEHEKYGNYLSYANQIESNPVLLEKYKWNSMNQNQKRNFLKLYKKLYSPNNSVYIKDCKDYTSLQSYLEKSNENFYKWNSNIQYFPNLKIWLDKLIGDVFTGIGRTMFFLHEHDCQLLIHRDGTAYRPHKNEFLWINPTESKSFFIYNEDTKEKHYVKSKSAFFNDLDMHGGDPNPTMTWTLRIDGIFTENFRKKLKIDQLLNY